MAPMSWSTSSAAIVSPRMRESAKATSWCCFVVCGLFCFVVFGEGVRESSASMYVDLCACMPWGLFAWVLWRPKTNV